MPHAFGRARAYQGERVTLFLPETDLAKIKILPKMKISQKGDSPAKRDSPLKMGFSPKNDLTRSRLTDFAGAVGPRVPRYLGILGQKKRAGA